MDAPALQHKSATNTSNRQSGVRRRILLTLCLGVLLAQIDTSVVNLALRPIANALGLGVSKLQWVIDGYNLTYALLLLTGGLLGDLLGRRRIFITGIGIFCAGCLTCGVAPGAGTLVSGRVVAGLGAALLLPASLAILRVEWPEPAERGHALGIWAGCNGLAFAIGPTLGGLLIESLGWRSIFLIVLPFGVFTAILAWKSVPESSDPRGRRFDVPGQLLGALALGGLALAAIEGREAPTLLAVALPIVAVAAAWFVAIERRHDDAGLVPLSLFRLPAFSGAMCATAAMTFGMYGLLFLVPLCWQATDAGAIPLSPVQAGLGLLPMSAVFFAVSRYSGTLLRRYGARTAIAGGTAMIGLGLILVALSHAGRPMAFVQVGLILAGVGMGLNTGPLMGVAVAAAPPARSGTASSLINVARMVGATLGVAALGSLFALRGEGAAGLRAALLVGGLVQIVGAAIAWLTIKRDSHV